MNAKDLMKAALAKKLEEHSKEELIDMITEVASTYFLAKLFVGVDAAHGRVSDTIEALNSNMKDLKSLTEQDVKEDFRRFCVLKDAGMF